MLVLDPPYKSLQFPTCLWMHLPSRVHKGHVRRHGKRSLECCQLKGPTIRKTWTVITFGLLGVIYHCWKSVITKYRSCTLLAQPNMNLRSFIISNQNWSPIMWSRTQQGWRFWVNMRFPGFHNTLTIFWFIFRIVYQSTSWYINTTTVMALGIYDIVFCLPACTHDVSKYDCRCVVLYFIAYFYFIFWPTS